MKGFPVTYCFFLISIVVLVIIKTGSADRQERDASNWIVTTLVEKPYVTTKKPNPTSNDDFEGFIPDMLKKIGDKLNQKYTLELVSDQRYGSTTDEREWNGLIGELQKSKADIAAAPITISAARRNVVDFTTPFMKFDTVIVMHKPANGTTVKTLQDLLEQSEMKFGVIRDGTTEQLIISSENQELKNLKSNLDKVTSQEKGIENVRNHKNGKYAFIIEEKTADFWTMQKPCDLVMIKLTDKLPSREYAFALKRGSSNLEKVNNAIKELNANGELAALKNKWWKNECNGSAGDASKVSNALSLLLSITLTVLAAYIYH